MSRLITVSIIFAVIIFGAVSSVLYISKTEHTLQIQLDEIVIAVENDEMEKAEQLSDAFLKKWEELEPFFIVLIRHHSIDEITKHASSLSSFCRYDSKANAIAQISTIKALLKHMSDDEKAKLHNIF